MYGAQALRSRRTTSSWPRSSPSRWRHWRPGWMRWRGEQRRLRPCHPRGADLPCPPRRAGPRLHRHGGLRRPAHHGRVRAGSPRDGRTGSARRGQVRNRTDHAGHRQPHGHRERARAGRTANRHRRPRRGRRAPGWRLVTGYDDLLAGLRRADSARSLLAAWAQVCAARSRWAITRSQFAALKAVRAEREKAVTPLRLDTPSGRRCASVVDGEPCNGRMRLDIGPSDTPDSRIAIEQVWICDVCGSAEAVGMSDRLILIDRTAVGLETVFARDWPTVRVLVGADLVGDGSERTALDGRVVCAEVEGRPV